MYIYIYIYIYKYTRHAHIYIYMFYANIVYTIPIYFTFMKLSFLNTPTATKRAAPTAPSTPLSPPVSPPPGPSSCLLPSLSISFHYLLFSGGACLQVVHSGTPSPSRP